jgi:hypothetical protein
MRRQTFHAAQVVVDSCPQITTPPSDDREESIHTELVRRGDQARAELTRIIQDTRGVVAEVRALRAGRFARTPTTPQRICQSCGRAHNV